MKIVTMAAYVLAGVVAGSAIGVGSGGVLAYRYYRSQLPDHFHTEIREKAILSQAAQSAPGGSVIFGDSIVELALLEGVCGGTVLNAGVGGARLDDVIRLHRQVLALKPFKSVIISVGINDAQKSNHADIQTWLSHYESLLQNLRNYTVYVMAINPVESGKALGDTFFDRSFIAAQNAGLSALAKANHAEFVEAAPAAEGLTTDGVHPNAKGYDGYRKRLATALGCSLINAQL